MKRILGPIAVAWLIALPGAAFATITNVDEADDICPPTADPCVITETVETVDGANLDFGVRAVEITGGGEIDAGTGNVTLRCGQLTVDTSGTAIILKGIDTFGETEGGFGLFLVQRACSGNGSILCVSDTVCSSSGAGTCSVGSGNAVLDGKVLASADDPGSFTVRAAGDITVLSTIIANGTSIESDGGSIDLDAGGSLTVDAKIQATAGLDSTGGDVCLTADGPVVVNDLIDVNGGDFDGGFVEIDSDTYVLITQDIQANAVAGEGYGGEIAVQSSGDIDIIGGGASNRLSLSTNGHESTENFGGDGGAQDYFADGDIYVSEFVKFQSDGAPPDGFGDTITLDADGDILVEGDAQANGTGNFGGDGGAQDYFADEDIYVSEFVKFQSDGAPPDGFGDTITLDADGDILVEGDAQANGTGNFGAGGEVAIDSFSDVHIMSTAKLEVTGIQSGGGDVCVNAVGLLTLDGHIDVSASPGGIGGSAELDSDTEVVVNGKIDANGVKFGGASGLVDIRGCRISLLEDAQIDNRVEDGLNQFIVNEDLVADAGSDVFVDGNGINRIFYRSESKPPVLNGSFDPSPTLFVNPALPPCPVCGNGDLEPGETCDDMNTSPGDGCSADCQDEGCIADTPGYPGVALCDDGDACTVDSCNTVTSSCDHSSSCDDGIACTIDTCMGASCIYTPDDSLCDDADACSDDVCSEVSGCMAIPVAGPCDDGVFCNGTDSCSGGACASHSGNPCVGQPECQDGCDESQQICASPLGTPCTDDGNDCTADVCDGQGSCVNAPIAGPCDDGIFCNGTDSCGAGECNFHNGDPCLSGADCMNTCNETEQQCITPAGEPCSDDGNVCTDDTCDGAGGCLHTNNLGPCDDGDFCTVGDQCSGGTCTAGDVEPFSSARIIVVRKSGESDDQITIRAELPLASLSVLPSDSGMRLQIRDQEAVPGYESIMPAAAIDDVGGSQNTFKFRNGKGLIAEANGLRVATVKRNTTKGTVRIKAKMKGSEVPGIAAQQHVSMSLLFGQDAGSGDCLTAAELPCDAKGSKFDCE